MLTNLPVVTPEALEAQKATVRWRGPDELQGCLNELKDRNPLLAQRLRTAVEACLDFEAAPDLACLSEETLALVEMSITQGMLLVLDLVDRELFASKHQALMAK